MCWVVGELLPEPGWRRTESHPFAVGKHTGGHSSCKQKHSRVYAITDKQMNKILKTATDFQQQRFLRTFSRNIRGVQVKLMYLSSNKLRICLHFSTGSEVSGVQVSLTIRQLKKEQHRTRATEITSQRMETQKCGRSKNPEKNKESNIGTSFSKSYWLASSRVTFTPSMVTGSFKGSEWMNLSSTRSLVRTKFAVGYTKGNKEIMLLHLTFS